MKNGRTAALHNLGCKVNAYETEAMQQLLEEHGYEIVSFDEKADVYLINTCSVTNMADRKSRQMLHKARKQNANAVIVAAGCYVQACADEILKNKDADLVIGNNQKNKLPELLEPFFEELTAASQSAVLDLTHNHEYEEMKLGQTAEHTRAFIKIQDGCNQFCSYCIIPYTRGRIRSRRPEDIVSEITALAAKGYTEVVLTGIHLSSYGKDLEEDITLLDAIKSVDRIPGIKRIRLGSLEPRIVTEEFAKEISSMEKMCPHFHLSLQSGCDATLKRMNRHYTADEYYECCRILRKYFDHPAITTDVIVGFAGETEEEFETTMAFLEKVDFYEMHIFKYSMRKGTRAAEMPNQVAEQVKTERSHKAIALGNQMSEAFRTHYIGKTVSVLLEEEQVRNGKTYMTGFTPEYVKIAVPMEDGLKPGDYVDCRVEKALAKDLFLGLMA